MRSINMKSAFVITVLSAMTMVFPAQARIGETEGECTARYGRPLSRENNFGLVALTYNFSGFSVAVAILNGTSQAEGYSKLAEGEEIELADIQRLLDVNSGSRKWKNEKATAHAPKVWKTDDSSRIAFYDVRNTLNIRTAIFEAFVNQKDESGEPFSTRGF